MNKTEVLKCIRDVGLIPQIELIPTGGVSLKTAADFLQPGAMALGVGADLVDPQALRESNSTLITERARQ